jgi:hypothetical protein
MKTIFEKIFHGFLYGLGFSVIFGGFYYFITLQITEEAMNLYRFESDAVEITKDRKIERNGKLIILGEATNKDSDEVRGVRVVVDLYLKDEFVKQCSEYISGAIPVEGSRNFEISCGGSNCSTNPIVEHDSYKIYVSGM